MAEAEDVITDAARHVTVFARDLWQRHRTGKTPQPLALSDIAPRLDLLIAAVFGTGYTLRAAQPPAPPTLLTRLFKHHERPWLAQAVPATDGVNIWLPGTLGIADMAFALERYRTLALQQAMRAQRGGTALLHQCATPLTRDLYTLFEADAADEALARLLPGMTRALNALRRAALAARPPLETFAPGRRPLEQSLRDLLAHECGRDASAPIAAAAQSLQRARELAAQWSAALDVGSLGPYPLLADLWTGTLRLPDAAMIELGGPDTLDEQETSVPRSARLARRPQVREAEDDEDDTRQGAWMVQTAQPHEQAEDPYGLQRPTDRDNETAADDFADALSELPEARLVSTPGRPKEVLLSDDPPEARARRAAAANARNAERITYPEWDYRVGAYRDPGATIVPQIASAGPLQWVDRTIAEHRAMLDAVRRQFEMLRARRMRLRKQLDGDDVDLEAYIDGHADFCAGLPLTQRLYQTRRPARRDLAIMLLIDISGSTDGWVSSNRRVIDVEREALLLVSIALEGMAEPYSILAFSGEGPHGVTVRTVKAFDERYGETVAQRIAALEPERYTRAGAAIRHAAALLMREPAQHRLLILLSDGKPNDMDEYEGRYGVEDMRQAVTEAKMQGIFPFCLTIDRQAANYLPRVFGPNQYALLSKPDLLPTVLIDWMKRLVVA